MMSGLQHRSPTRTTPGACRRTGRARVGCSGEQSGYSLIEVLLGLSISVMIVIPLLAWMTLALREQPRTEDGLLRIASTGLLASYLPKDVAVAGAAAIDQQMADDNNVNFDDCRNNGSGDGGTVLAVLIRKAEAPSTERTKIVYAEAALQNGTTVDTSRHSIWRRECDADTGQGTRSVQALEDVEVNSSAATCPETTGGVPCRQVEVRSIPVGGDEVTIRAMRRVDAASLDYLVTGNRVPVAKIKVISQAVRQPYVVQLSSVGSVDPGGSIACYEWSFPTVADGAVGDPERVTVEIAPDPAAPPGDSCPNGPGPPGDDGGQGAQVQVRTLPTSGVYFVELTVTDDQGVSSTTYKRIQIDPPEPIAAARVQPVSAPAVAGQSVFEFAARWFSEEDGREIGSEHPDGVIGQYEWVITAAGAGPDRTFIALSDSPAPWYLGLPESMAGSVTVVLTVTDELGRTNSAVSGLVLTAPDPPSDPPPATEPPLGTHLPPGGPSLADPVLGTPGSARLRWTPPPQVDRYLVQVEDTDPGGCVRLTTRVVAATADPSVPLTPNLCGQGAQSRVRVGAEFAGTVAWTPWVATAVLAIWAPEGFGELGG